MFLMEEWLEGHRGTLGFLVPHLFIKRLQFVRSTKQHTRVEQTEREHCQNNHATIEHAYLTISISVPNYRTRMQTDRRVAITEPAQPPESSIIRYIDRKRMSISMLDKPISMNAIGQSIMPRRRLVSFS